MTRRWLITGAGGQLGHHLRAAVPSADEVVALTRAQLDITDAEQVDAAIAEHAPDVVLNAAAYTKVDDAEDHEDLAHAVNADGPANLARALRTHGGRLIQISTDYVFAGTDFGGTDFSGTATGPYEIDAPTGPRSAYGRTKLAGERAVLAALPDRAHVVRSAWVYGGPGPNFVDTMLRLERSRDTLDVVDDQIGSPTWVADLAAALVELGSAAPPGGVLHYANSGQASWFELAREVFRRTGADPERVRPVDSAAFPRPAPRPAWSVLSTRAWTDAGLSAPRRWQDALTAALAVRPERSD